MKVKDIMSKPVTIDKSDRVSEALDLMDKQHVRRLIVRRNGVLMGIISLRSICGSLGSRRKYNHPPSLFHVADAVSNNYAVLGPEDDAQQAIEALKQVDTVVVEDGGILGAVSTSDVIRRVTPDGPVEAIMKMPQIAPPDARVSFIRKLMMDKGISRVPIMDGATLVGIVSETDVAAAFRGVKRRSSQNHQDNNVERMLAFDIMRADVVTVPVGTSIRDAAKLMIDRGIGALPVLNEQRHLVGIVTRRDIVRAI
ncbi:MAG: Inosine-5'-monophosphate dehydrogenase [Methanocella sp. PtaU1.Bin125]|nr:MAG: Inosine-5'-monophosphate dehydrogenase [Methanocella sp. PtaU1.Bin125]